MQITLVRSQQLPALRALYLASRRAAFPWLDTSGYALSDFERDTRDEQVLVAGEGAEVLGFIAVCPPDQFVHHLYVAPDRLRQGIGRALLRAARWRYPALHLKCLVRNRRALLFYRAMGFTCLGQGTGAHGEYYWLALMPAGGR
ncbi:GNAT family N-acetyltransferase [Pseudaeromonas sp. ZJS20]|uniref:GNAT family N-acetyltransferase n=1 Tax=Pseudaeromonas aegiceratis TaxID=3153928 RepID=UPI00390C4ECC